MCRRTHLYDSVFSFGVSRISVWMNRDEVEIPEHHRFLPHIVWLYDEMHLRHEPYAEWLY